MDEIELVRRCQQGDPAAYEALFQRCSRQVLQTAYLIIGDRHAAEDVMQEAFATTFRLLGQLREPRAFRSWLYRITVRLAQRSSIQARSEQRLLPAAEPAVDSHEEEYERRELVWAAITQLSSQQRAAVVLHYFHDFPVSEVATVMDAPEVTVKSWLYRARALLAERLGLPPVEGGAPGHG